ncbi:ankyrin repeat-containing domain protein [Cokeromyces recurvatus]|uniref:ankyrin repeat-containing domain protein n=1 Tax=Cokeromyces recurvatus TaxID=90255 RepID=UPI00221F7D6C|nr:ankyrin repeat-containing domain protein [Cokeromyces recurvatus]KAI7901136.1 ankyrin repeat-containing domain protein [Cokeromyces recurvatus]
MTDHAELLDDLIYFARAGELEDIKELKLSPETLVEKDESGKTALHMASANNHVDIVTYIVEQLSTLDEKKKVELINIKNDQGNTPLHWAALNGHYDVVEILIKNNMNISPIYEAQQRNHEKIAEYFLNTMVEDEPEEPIAEDEQYVETGVPESGSGN